jgi:prophage tail gpP-like protein
MAVVTGRRDGAGKLWAPNSTVSVQLPTAKIRGEDRAISEVTFMRGAVRNNADAKGRIVAAAVRDCATGAAMIVLEIATPSYSGNS